MRCVVAGSLVAVLLAISVAGAGPTANVQRGMLNLEMAAIKATYGVGEPVELMLRLSNRGTGPLVFEFNDGQRYDFVARREDGSVVWVWSHNKAFIQVLGSLTLGPGESRTFRDRWDQKDNNGAQVRTGRYIVEGVFPPRREGALPGRPAAENPRVTIVIGEASGEAVSRVTIESRAAAGGQIGEVVMGGRAVLRIRVAAGGLNAPGRAQIVADRLRTLIAQGVRARDLSIATVGGEVAIVARGHVVVTADRNHARANNTTPRALANLWLRALSAAF